MRTKDNIMLEQAYALVRKQQFSEMAEVKYSQRVREKGYPPHRILFMDGHTKEKAMKELQDTIERMEAEADSISPQNREGFSKELSYYKKELEWLRDYDEEAVKRAHAEWAGGDTIVLDQPPDDVPDTRPAMPVHPADEWKLNRKNRR
jgi:hypothetical protein